MKAWDGKFANTINFKNALLVPELRNNLLSVAKMTDSGHTVKFFENFAIVRNAKSNEVKFIADRIRDLYYLNEAKEEEALNTAELKLCREMSLTPRAWHERLGHLNMNDVLEMSRKKIVRGMKLSNQRDPGPCSTCREGKFTSIPFSGRSERRTKLLEIVHADVCGPMRT